MPRFVKGLKLSALYYERVVKPIIESNFPELEYSAGLIGSGSEVLGYDTRQSSDHNWGPRLFIFLSENDFEDSKDKVDLSLREKLPYTFLGYSTSFGKPDQIGVRLQEQRTTGNIEHYIEVHTIRSYFKGYLNIDPYNQLSFPTWLTISEQKLLSIVKGRIFHDDLGLRGVIKRFQYFPKDVWLYLLASQWSRISQIEAFVGRTADVGDELGSKLMAAKIIRELMRLSFLMERKYAPYEKWFGTAFSELRIAKRLTRVFSQILAANSPKEREILLSNAYEIVAIEHNSLNITKPLPTEVSKFHNRPYLVIHGEIFSAEIRKKIKSRAVRDAPLLGSVNQFLDSTEAMENTDFLEKMRNFFLVS